MPPEESAEPQAGDEPSPTDEEAAWAAIVAHYGERPDLDEADPEAAGTAHGAAEPAPAPPRQRPTSITWTVPSAAAREPEDLDEHFEPPEPPPLPLPAGPRLAAWSGLFGAPLALILMMAVPALRLPTWFPLLMVLWFVGGFLYLVANMSREPREPWDDGAQL